MSPRRFAEITGRYAALRMAVVGDFCLDRYLEIDPALTEVSIETGLPVHNVVRVRAQPGAAGTVLNNLAALGIGTLWPVGFCGEDGEGYELRRALAALPGVRLDHFRQTPERRTFTYCKPLVLVPGAPPRELERLDSKNFTPTPESLSRAAAESLVALAREVDAIVVMDQVDLPGTGVIAPIVRETLESLGRQLPILADSRRGLHAFHGVILKMNATELAGLVGHAGALSGDEARAAAATLGGPAFITLAEGGILGALTPGRVEHVPALPVRGPIDIVGAGDSVTANLGAALAARATEREAMELAMAAASVVIHQLGTTGTASLARLSSVFSPPEAG